MKNYRGVNRWFLLILRRHFFRETEVYSRCGTAANNENNGNTDGRGCCTLNTPRREVGDGGSTEIPQDLASGFLLGCIQSRIGAATALYIVDYERKSDGNTLDGSVTH